MVLQNDTSVKASIKKLDIGGFLVTIYRLINDTRFIQEVKEEFVFNNFKSMLFRS